MEGNFFNVKFNKETSVYSIEISNKQYSRSIFLCHLLRLLRRFGNGEYKLYQEHGLSPQQTALELQGQLLDYERDWWRRNFKIQFNSIQTLSSMPYEGAKLKTCLALTLPNSYTNIPSKQWIIRLKPENDTHYALLAKNAKTLRKIAEGAKDNAVAFCYQTVQSEQPSDEKLAYCLCGYVDLSQRQASDIFPIKIEISGSHRWTLSYLGEIQFEVEDNSIQFVKKQSLVKKVLNAILDEIPQVKDKDSLESIIEALKNQSHGTSAIFYSDQASANQLIKNRFDGLCKNLRGMKCSESWKKFDRSGGTGSYTGITNLAGIDGALVLDPVAQKVLYSMIIVDGIVCHPGDPSRGARHNSIKTFMEGLADTTNLPAEARAVAVVFSEDGGAMVFSLSKLRPPKP